MKKILHIAVHMGGGVGKAISGLCISSQDEYDNAVVLLEMPSDYFYVNRISKKGISVHIIPKAHQLEKLIHDADIVIVNWWGHPLMAKCLQNFPKIPCRCIIWNHINGCSYPYLPADFLQCFAAVMFTTGYSYKNCLWSEYEHNTIKDISEVVYGMGNFIPASIKPKEEYVCGDTFVVGYVGTIDYAKINRRFLDYYSALIDDIPEIKFCMLGHISDVIKQEIIDRNLQKYFDLPGYVRRIDDYMRRFDVFAYLLAADNYATTENALLEAMAYGLPIVVLNNNVEENIVQNDVSGYIVTTIDDFKQRIKYLRKEKNAVRLGKSAREYVINEYSLKNNMNRYYTICANVIRESKKIYDYTNILGKDGFEAFMYFAQADGNKIYEAVNNNRSVDNINPIFYGEYKGSVYQYLHYYADDEKLQRMAAYLQNQGKGNIVT